ncbi:META domain-containing protein [Thalassotalea sp. 1_MG-2023]|uniref:META domain-containing protein n=1 Tax=Thalassotalea sp. 1_MG-2023 TaxID=3062680 RepID=UPI0026E35E6F|nr:META domain-containing protein [Thalassotalea sp. 1_MG-2023]MDO6426089.1 META domain-containing protein [Thalassotalea sp. 1_MG-2023]
MFISRALAIFFLVFTLSACQQEQRDENLSLPVETLKNVRWQLESAQGFSLPNKTELIPFIEFIETGKVSGFTGCNRFQGGVNIDDSTIQFAPLAMSKRYCMETAEIESLFVQALEQVAQGHITENTLTFYDQNDKAVLTFVGQSR